jgi:hypothetical protein
MTIKEQLVQVRMTLDRCNMRLTALGNNDNNFIKEAISILADVEKELDRLSPPPTMKDMTDMTDKQMQEMYLTLNRPMFVKPLQSKENNHVTDINVGEITEAQKAAALLALDEILSCVSSAEKMTNKELLISENTIRDLLQPRGEG